ncbi:T9SS type B sorting domain-containing protein [Tamlana sp. I1]|uniref:T9SS type B sorting domain-containing protein n=1 Tax=Tamlana sp. I1 TaxID=2762061 RepID=UPI001890306A|nr:T9SS type B sorting domain-containing protein [Tamlana sp. I1]
MHHANHLKPYLFLIFMLIGYLGFSQLSKTHYIPPLTNAAFGNANPEDQYIYISTPSAANVSYTIIPVGQPVTSQISGVVSNTNPQVKLLANSNGQLFMTSNETSQITTNKGYVIEADAPIYVSIRMNAGGGAQAGALVSKGLSALGTTFRVGTFTNENPQSNYLNFVSVMATEDNTQVNFSDLPTGLIIKNYAGTTPINITLNEGESYTIAINSADATINRDGLIGCLVQSDKPIVVNCGSANGSFHNGGGRDYGIDQIADLSKVGKEYIFVKGGGNNNWENILIVAHTNGTEISINGNPTIATINAGEYYLIEGNSYNSNGNMYVKTSEAVFAYQGVGANDSEANQGLFFVPPLSCETRGNIDNIANIDKVGNTIYSGGVTIVTKTGANVTINHLALSNFSTIGPSAVTGNANYVTYKINGLTGNISVQGDNELYVAYFNENNAATSGSFYSGFPAVPEINFDAEFATLGNCIPNITLEAANTQNFDSFKWMFDDGSGFVDLMISTPKIKPSLPGKYKLVGIITCTGEELESAEIPVSICPDDIDNDGIIDNIDIDNDNDGILNCTESRGDVILDLADTRPPRLRFQDGTINTTLAVDNITLNRTNPGTSSIRLTGTGTFISNIPPDSNAENNYDITFNESVNFKFSEDISYTHNAIDGEYFIAKVSPVNKNITLVDPDNRLLVDSNFDGIFETGVTLISGSEIRFKINPSPLGNTPYQFLANQVDSFTFTHKLANTTSSSTYNGIISLTCFKKDTDLDGVEDALDLDSDNDGIPDFIENQGILLALSGIDADANGLDDVYDSTLIPIDTDNDGVPDFYDLDSDNDGIYDLFETGQLGLTLFDSDLNGIEDGPNFGTNGWADAAETAPDSHEMGYTLNDLDGDTVFSYLDSDSDDDGCSDVIEAGFSDGNDDGYLGNISVTTDASGLVNNASDGYTLPNNDYLNSAALSISTQPTNTTICESSNGNISVISPEAETYQWEVSTDGIIWTAITDDLIYSNSQTNTLNFSSLPLNFNTNQYRVKLDRTGNACGLYSDAVTLTVNPLPIINSPVILIQCDDNDPATLGFSAFNLTEANDEISTNASNETFAYFLTQTAAVSGDITSPEYINNPTTFTNRTINSDVVWARISSQSGCASVAEIQLNVSTTVIPSTFLATFNQCDDFLDINGNDNANNNARDGIATFDFSSVTATILGFIPPGQNPLPPRYFKNEADALAEINEITNISNYRNIGYPGSQYIYVRIDSNISNDCLGLGAYVLLTVEALPVANPVTIQRQCDDDTDGAYPFVTSQIETQLLGTQNPSDVNITYFDALGNTLPSPLPDPFLTASQTITIVVTNSASSAPDGPCSDETTLEFIVDAQPIANPVGSQIVCDGAAGDIDDDGLYAFNTSNFTSNILGSQSNMEIYYDYIDENGNSILNSPTIPNPFTSTSQIITAKVINPINTSCFATTTIELVVNPLPEFTVESPRIVCSSDPSFSILLDPEEANPSEIFDYEWLWISLDGTTSNQFISNNSEITVSTPGTYTVTLTKTDGSSCSRSREILVNASEMPHITQDDVTIKDLSENNSVTIDPTNLGQGNYEYALRLEGTNFIVYQEAPFFDNVSPGFHTIFVKDAICGTASLDISVIGHAKFFTPNGDGFNDFWEIKGLSNVVQPNSVILIYNRYGKLMKQLSVQSNGWDGTCNGSKMPTDDYWFRVVLEDGREFSGHFTLKR